jgi:hypothetical protein
MEYFIAFIGIKRSFNTIIMNIFYLLYIILSKVLVFSNFSKNQRKSKNFLDKFESKSKFKYIIAYIIQRTSFSLRKTKNKYSIPFNFIK